MRLFPAQPPPNRLQISARSCECHTNTDAYKSEAESRGSQGIGILNELSSVGFQVMGEIVVLDRSESVGHGRRLEYFTIAWNTVEGLVAVVAGLIAGSISLVGFGIDSFIEVTSGTVLLWRMSVDARARDRERNEKRALKVVGVCFLALAAYIAYESATDFWSKRTPDHSIPGIILACVSLVVMPILSRAKRRVGLALGSAAMHADAKQTEFCTYLSAILLVGLLLNAVFGLWWADAAAGLIMVPIIA